MLRLAKLGTVTLGPAEWWKVSTNSFVLEGLESRQAADVLEHKDIF